MNLTMISSSILNSLGFEKKTFLFFFVGAASLLLSILFLPAFCGAYAYLIGLGASYVATAACNLVFLYKQCPFLKTTCGQVRDYAPFFALFSILPFSLLGQLCVTLFKQVFGNFLCLVCSASILFIAVGILYLSLHIIRLPTRKKKALLFREKFFSRP